jgi:hypothetical protein
MVDEGQVLIPIRTKRLNIRKPTTSTTVIPYSYVDLTIRVFPIDQNDTRFADVNVRIGSRSQESVRSWRALVRYAAGARRAAVVLER